MVRESRKQMESDGGGIPRALLVTRNSSKFSQLLSQSTRLWRLGGRFIFVHMYYCILLN